MSDNPLETEVHLTSASWARSHGKYTETHVDRWLMGKEGGPVVPQVPPWQRNRSSSCYMWVTVQHILLYGTCIHPAGTWTHTHEHLESVLCDPFLCRWMCVCGRAPSCLEHTKHHKEKDKNTSRPQRSQRYPILFVWALCWCCSELLKQMWNYLTKALKEGA